MKKYKNILLKALFLIVLVTSTLVLFVFLRSSLKHSTPKESTTFNVARVEISRVNIREKPSINSPIIRTADHGQEFKIIKTKDTWVQIELPTKQIGYMTETAVSIHQITLPKEVINLKKGPLQSKVIVLDPGHGGNDGGTTGILGTQEKFLTLKTALLLKKQLEEKGATVILTRSNDSYVPLSDRTFFSNQFRCDAYISLHYDSFDNKNANGITVFYYNQSSGKSLAANLHSYFLTASGLNNRNIQFGNLQVLRDNEQPAVLIELGFLSNEQEEKQVQTDNYQQSVSQAIINGVMSYLK